MNTSFCKDLLFRPPTTQAGIPRIAQRLIAFVSMVVLASSAARAETNLTPQVKRLMTYRFGGDRTILDDVAHLVSTVRTDPMRRREAAQELAGVLKSDASFDAKEFACRQLVFIADVEEVPALTSLLDDDRLAHYALMALAQIPGKAVDSALFRALPNSKGRTQLEIIDMLGNRKGLDAIPSITHFLESSEFDTASAAALALAKMTTPAAVPGLEKAFISATDARKLAFGHALLDAADRLSTTSYAARSLSLYELVDRDSTPVLRAGALRGIVRIRGVEAMPQVITALHEDGSLRQSEAIRLTRRLPDRESTVHLAAELPKLSTRGKLLLLDALSERGDVGAGPAVLAACSSSEPAVRSAAVRALGSVGNASSVTLLLSAAAGGEDREVARMSLARLRDPAADSKLVASVEVGPSALRVEAIKALGNRGVTSSVPQLIKAARAADRGVSAAALRVLRDMAPPAELSALISVLLSTPAGNRDNVIETVAEIARRGTTETQRTGALVSQFKAARRPPDQVDLLTVLAQVGGQQAFASVRSAAGGSSPELRSASLRALAEWSTDEPMPDLLRIVRESKNQTDRAIALRGYIRMIGMNEQRSPEQSLSRYKSAGLLSRGPDDTRLILAGLAKVRSLPALQYAATYLKDPAVKGEAEVAVVEIARSTAGAFPVDTRVILANTALESSNEMVRAKARETLALMGKFGDYVTAWEVSPAYQQSGADYSKLFDIAFAPEDSARAKTVPWRIMPAGGGPDQPWLLDLLAALGGEQRVAYLRTSVWSGSPSQLVLELGSDDGIKVWWSGAVVLAKNTARAVAPGQEKVHVQAKAGWNPLMLKVTQNVMGWGAVARFTNSDGSPATGLKFSVASDTIK